MPGFSQRNIPFRRERHARRKRRFSCACGRSAPKIKRVDCRARGKGKLFRRCTRNLLLRSNSRIQLEAFPRLWNRDFPFVAMDGGFIYQHVNPVRFRCARYTRKSGFAGAICTVANFLLLPRGTPAKRRGQNPLPWGVLPRTRPVSQHFPAVAKWRATLRAAQRNQARAEPYKFPSFTRKKAVFHVGGGERIKRQDIEIDLLFHREFSREPA